MEPSAAVQRTVAVKPFDLAGVRFVVRAVLPLSLLLYHHSLLQHLHLTVLMPRIHMMWVLYYLSYLNHPPILLS